MADTSAANTNTNTNANTFTVTIPASDGTFQVNALLQENKDATRPPGLLTVTRESTSNSVSSTTPDSRETHIILSTGSGHREAANFYEHVAEPILRILYPSDIGKFHKHFTQSETTILDLTRDIFVVKANLGNPLRIILASGDGGMVDLVNGLLAQPASAAYIAPQVVLLPLGTANALYHSINSTQSNTWGLSALSSSTTKPLPVFTATFSPDARLLVDEARKEEVLPTNEKGEHILHGAVVCSWGMHASLVADSDTTEYRKYGIDRFKMAAKEALYPADGSPPHAYQANVSLIKGKDRVALPEAEHMYVLATLVSNLEAPFCISPWSKPLDGSLHLVQFGPTSGDEAMRIMGLAYQGGKHIDDPAVRYESIDGLRIDFAGKEEQGRWRRICVDGKIVRLSKDGWVEIKRDERRVIDVVIGTRG